MSEKSLSELQRSLFSGVRELPGISSEAVVEAEALIKDQAPLDPSGRLDIYRTAHWLRLFGSLQEDFPRVQKLLGEELFEKACESFIRDMPSRFESISEVSGDLSTYFGHSKWDINYPGIQDLARFEWLIVKKDYRLSPPALEWRKITETPLEQLGSFCVRLNPTAEFHRFQYLVHSENPIRHQPVLLAFFSTLNEVGIVEVNAAEIAVLEFIRESRTIDEIAELTAQTDLSPEQLMPLFSNWVSEGLIVQG